MCRPGAGLVTVAVSMAVLGALPPLQAQEPAEREGMEQELLRRLDEVGDRLERARSRATREKEAAEALAEVRAEKGLDTVRVGPLRIVARPERTAEAAELFQDVWSEMAPMVGDAVDLSRALFLYDPDDDIGPVVLSRHYRVRGGWRGLPSREVVVRNARGSVRREIAVQAPPALRRWTGSLGPQAVRSEAVEDLYRQLVLTPSVAAESCVAGRAEGCWAAMGLGLSDEPWAEWYTEDQLQPARAARLRGWLECMDSDRAELCLDFFSSPRAWMGAIPLGAPVRADLLGFALEQGGEGALGRLLGSPVPEIEEVDGQREVLAQADFARAMRAGLAAAAGTSEDELVSRWRERLVAARPDVEERGERTRAATFLWILTFTFFATRSTRWRLG